MAFSVSYTYKLIDKYTPKLKEIERQTTAFNNQVTKLHKNMSSASNSMKDMGRASASASRGIEKAARASKKMSKFSARMGKAGKAMSGFATSAGAMGASLAGGLGLKVAVKAAIDLESAMTGVEKVFGDIGKARKFQDTLTNVGSVIGQSRIEMNNLAAAAGKLGIPLDEVAKFAELTGKVAVAFDTDLGQATTFLADMRTKLGLNNTELKTTLDTINTLADSTSASGADILQVTQRLSGLFKALKVPPDVAVGFATVARQLEVSPELAASKMKMFIQRLQDVKKFKPEIAEGLTKDFKGTIDAVLAKFGKMEQVTRNLKIQQLFGTEAAPFIMNLVASQDLYNKTLGTAIDKTKTKNSMDKEFERQTKTTAFAMQQAKAALSNMAATIGTELAPAFKEFLIFVTKAANGISEFVKGHPMLTKIGAIFALIAAVVAPLALTLGTVFAVIGTAGVTAMLSFAGIAAIVALKFIVIGAIIGGIVLGIYELGRALGVIDEIKSVTAFKTGAGNLFSEIFGGGDDNEGKFNMAAAHQFTGPRMPPPGETSAAAGAKNSFQGSIDNNINLSLPAGFGATTESFTSAMPTNVGLNTASGA